MSGDLRAALSSQHKPIETVDADGDDWIGCLCGERECVVLALIPEGAVLVTEETLAAGLGDWVRVRNETCDEPSPCDHDRLIAAVMLCHLREGT